MCVSNDNCLLPTAVSLGAVLCARDPMSPACPAAPMPPATCAGMYALRLWGCECLCYVWPLMAPDVAALVMPSRRVVKFLRFLRRCVST